MIEDINAHGPRIVLVGMGTPKQELWVDRYADRLDGAVVWTVGALFDYVSGRTPRAPRWLADNGLEWIFRLAIEPQRMWRRYLLGNPVFLSRVLTEAKRRAGRAGLTGRRPRRAPPSAGWRRDPGRARRRSPGTSTPGRATTRFAAVPDTLRALLATPSCSGSADSGSCGCCCPTRCAATSRCGSCRPARARSGWR